MATVQERYTPFVVGVNSTINVQSSQVAGFLAQTSGTLTITKIHNGAVIVNAVPVTAGVWTPMPFYVGVSGLVATTAGGASGTLGA